MGYAFHSNAYKFLIIDSKNNFINKNIIFETKDAEFFLKQIP